MENRLKTKINYSKSSVIEYYYRKDGNYGFVITTEKRFDRCLSQDVSVAFGIQQM